MTSRTTLWGIIITVAAALTSCLSNDTDYVYYDDVAVTGFTIGTVYVERHTTSSDGEDSTYTYTYSASSVPVTIDQLNGRIYTLDSLPVGTDLSRVPTTITTKNNGTPYFYNPDDSIYYIHTSSDSVDYTEPRTLRVLSSNGQNVRDYIVEISAHQEYADSFSWQQMPAQTAIQRMQTMKAVTVGNRLFLLGRQSDGELTMLTTTDASEWNSVTLPCATTAQTASVASNGQTVMLLADDTIYTSEDGEQWTSTPTTLALKAVVGGTESESYAITTEGQFAVTTDDGQSWQLDNIEATDFIDNSIYMPLYDYNVVSQTLLTNSDVERVTMLGRRNAEDAVSDSTAMVVWSKVVDPDDETAWFYSPFSTYSSSRRLPTLYDLSAIYYANSIIVMGATTQTDDGQTDYSAMYYSPDMGRTWHEDTTLELPEEFATMTTATMAADEQGFFYLIGADSSSQTCTVWKVKQNKALWEVTSD